MYSKGSVLVVDDEINLCRILGAKLAKNGYSVVAVHDGLQAVEKVRESEFDCVLLDLILPKMDGLTALAEIRSLKKALPVIVMSAYENSEAIEQALSGGARAYIKKPFDLDSLVALVRDTSQGEETRVGRPPSDASVLFAKSQPVTLDVPSPSGRAVFDSQIEDKDDETLSVLAPTTLNGEQVDIPVETSVRVGLAGSDAYYSFDSSVIEKRDNGRALLVLDKPAAVYRTQRREHPRRSIRAQARYRRMTGNSNVTGHLEPATAVDISIGGVRLALNKYLEPGQVVYVEIDVGDDIGRVSATAHVVRCHESKTPDLPAFEAGLRFSDLDKDVGGALATS